MKSEESFNSNSVTGNDSTDKRQTSPLGTSGSDGMDKAELNQQAAKESAGLDKPETGPLVTQAQENAGGDKNLTDMKPETSPPASEETAPAAKPEEAAPAASKAEASDQPETAPSAALQTQTPETSQAAPVDDAAEDKTDPLPLFAQPESAAKTEAGTTGTATQEVGQTAGTAATAPTAEKLGVSTTSASTASVTASPDTASPAPKPAGVTTHRLDGIKPEPGSKQDTYVLTKNRTLRAMLDKRTAKTADSAPPEKIVTLMIRGVAERIALSSNSIILGRAELQTRGFQPDVDLSPYGAQMRGVSRVHARMFLQDRHLYIADLYSTNGTYIAGRRLEPNDPYRLHNGTELLLGSLMIQVLFD